MPQMTGARLFAQMMRECASLGVARAVPHAGCGTRCEDVRRPRLRQVFEDGVALLVFGPRRAPLWTRGFSRAAPR